MSSNKALLKAYFFPILLITSLLLGGIFGFFFRDEAHWLKPLGDIFLNLILTMIVPLIFFSVSAAVSKRGAWKKLGNIFFAMASLFLLTGIVAAFLSIIVVKVFPIGQGIDTSIFSQGEIAPKLPIADQLVGIFTVSDFSRLLSHHQMLALIVFSLLVGIAAAHSSKEDKLFVNFLQAGEKIFMRVFSYIMYLAPIGFFSYFANLVGELGPQIMEHYLRVAVVYYAFGLVFFMVCYSIYAYIADGDRGVKLFWRNIFLPATTSLATCSSAASIPANLEAIKNIGASSVIYETVIPLGTLIHKDGSVMGGIFKIAFIFGVYQLDFSGTTVLLTALGVSLLVGTVMGAIPSGGMLGELLILTVYGFPPTALIAIAAISIIIDPLATMLNVTGNTACTMLVARWVEGKDWVNLNATEV